MAKTAPLDSNRYFSDIEGWLIALFIMVLIHAAALLSVSLRVQHTAKTDQPAHITTIEWLTQKAPHPSSPPRQPGKPQPATDHLALSGQHFATKIPARNQYPTDARRPVKTKKTAAHPQIAEKAIATPAKSAILKATEAKAKPRITAETLQQQIAQLGSEIRLNQQDPEQAKIKFADQFSKHKFVASQYITDLKNKVQQAAEMSSLKELSKKQWPASLSLDVGINTDGGIYSIRISKSSGNPALDDAAKRMVKISAPFPPLPLELSKELRVLVIPITWYFTEQSGMTAR